jgi:hypothetical protein
MSLEHVSSALPPGSREVATVPQAEGAEAGLVKRRGRRRSHAEHWTKVTVVLLDRQIVYLDRLAADIRAANRGSISRAHLIRALIEALAASDVDLTSARSESDLRALLTTRLRREAAA